MQAIRRMVGPVTRGDGFVLCPVGCTEPYIVRTPCRVPRAGPIRHGPRLEGVQVASDGHLSLADLFRDGGAAGLPGEPVVFVSAGSVVRRDRLGELILEYAQVA